LPRETPTVDRCRDYGKRDRISGRGVPSGNGSCLLHARGRGGSVSDSKYASRCHDGWRALTEEWTHRGGGHVVSGSLLFWCTVYDSSGNQLGAHRRAYGKRDVDGRPRVDYSRATLRPKGDESKHARTSRLRGPQLARPKRSLLSLHLSVLALFPFTRVTTSPLRHSEIVAPSTVEIFVNLGWIEIQKFRSIHISESVTCKSLYVAKSLGSKVHKTSSPLIAGPYCNTSHRKSRTEKVWIGSGARSK
jgi:hypothetical protein